MTADPPSREATARQVTRIFRMMNQEPRKPGKDCFWFSSKSVSRIETQSLPSLLRCCPLAAKASPARTLLSRKSLSWIPAFLISSWASGAFAGDAVAIGYNADGVWTSVTYYSSGAPKGGSNYKTEAEAREEAMRDLRRRDLVKATRVEILSSSDSTGYVAVARGTDKSRKDQNVVGRGETQPEADGNAMTELNQRGATKNQKIVYRYFSHGADSR
jgi:hypothetical protein